MKSSCSVSQTIASGKGVLGRFKFLLGMLARVPATWLGAARVARGLAAERAAEAPPLGAPSQQTRAQLQPPCVQAIFSDVSSSEG